MMTTSVMRAAAYRNNKLAVDNMISSNKVHTNQYGNKTNYFTLIHLLCLQLTLSVYIVQFVKSSDNIAPRSPNKAPDAPTEMLFCMKREDNMLPPKPESKYSIPTRTAWLYQQTNSEHEILVIQTLGVEKK